MNSATGKAKVIILFLIVCCVIAGVASYFIIDSKKEDENASKRNNSSAKKDFEIEEKDDEEEIENENMITTNKLSKFDLCFLKLENKKENKIYSPLSIKYALKMLEEGAEGKSKKQIGAIIGNYDFKDYELSKNLSLANGLFVKNSYKETIKQDYIDLLKEKYDADVTFDSFEEADVINDWINEKTFEIIPEIIDDDTVKDLDFALVNALAIDMEWADKFVHRLEGGVVSYDETKYDHLIMDIDAEYPWEKMVYVSDIQGVSEGEFDGNDSKLSVSGMEIKAIIDNYDIVSELGEDNIKDTVTDQFIKYAKNENYDEEHVLSDYNYLDGESEETINSEAKEFVSRFMDEISENYHKVGYTTDFSFYTDEDVKVFVKDLKEYDDTTLEYIGIMPTEKDLDQFIENINVETINGYLNNTKGLDYKDFEEGKLYLIEGYIPKFKFEYDLSLKDDLELLGITDIFDKETADLSNLTDDEDAFIGTALHKANIEFTEDGIKAAAATLLGGLGAGASFDYYFDVPTEKIDLTFDKPYMFLIRDKETGETWFAGTVYEPLLWENETNKSGW